ncbi:hypothetical protein C2G38_2283414 [Gigaspora rosea]|uniref:Uncharacterized protein n=1 Tax=Gigaspora rosea TaxID=44941 RepID=A0A397VPT1_9GLOM|nr:hypothetical protein C2G38_2283414 [Gigaspora rosea]
MAFEQAYIQYLTEQLQEEAEEATDSDKNDEFEETNENEADQTNPTPLPSPTPKPNPSPLPSPTPLPTPTDNLFKRLQKEIEETQIKNAINLVDNKTIDQKIKNSKLQHNQIDQLQKIHGKRLRQLQGELYEDNVNLINRLDNINDLNRLFDNINSDQVITLIQISMLLQIIKTAINIEPEIKKLQDDWKIKIDAEIDQTFLLPPRSIEKIHQIREVRIATLQKPPKHPSSEDLDKENFPTQLPDNAKPVIGKDDKFLLTKYTKRKIEDVKVLIKNIDDYIWLMSTKKIKETKRNRLEKDPKYKDPAQYPILFNPGKFSLTNLLGFPEEYIYD